jgi:hypothetical protein
MRKSSYNFFDPSDVSWLFSSYLRKAKQIYMHKPDWITNLKKSADKELSQLYQIRPYLPEDQKKKILFWCMSPWSYIVVECILAAALKLRGHSPVMILCDGLDFCEASQEGISKQNCRKCFLSTRRYIEIFGLEWKLISEFITDTDKSEAQALIGKESDEELRFKVIKNIKLGELAQYNTCYYQGIPIYLWDLENKENFRNAIKTGYIVIRSCERLLTELKPDIVITVGTKSILWAPVFELAQQKKMTVTNWEDWSVHPQGFRFAHDQPATRGFLTDIWAIEKEKKLTKKQKNELDLLFNQWKKGEITPYNYYPNPLEDINLISRRLNLNPYQRIIAAFPNIAREDHFIRINSAFNNQIEWLSGLIEHAKSNPDFCYLIRCHPAEVKLPQEYIMNRIEDLVRRFNPDIPPNVIFIPPESDISSYSIGELADSLLVWTGTLGLEFALKGRNVMVVGEPGYRDKGFTTDITDKKELNVKLSDGSLKREITTLQREYAERYAYLLRIRTLVKFPFVNDHKYRIFHIENFEELLPQHNTVINDLCECILFNKPFIDIGEGNT